MENSRNRTKPAWPLLPPLPRSAEEANEPILVIGHKNPDTDSVTSAIAYADLLNKAGIPARAVLSGPLNGETAFILNLFGITPPALLPIMEGKRVFLVDHSTYAQAAEGMAKARVIGIIDHHSGGDVKAENPANVCIFSAGAAASLVYLAWKECGETIPQQTAGLILTGILSDTRNMKRNVTDADREAYQALAETAGIDEIESLYRDMASALASYGSMSSREIFQSDCKEYEAGGVRFLIGDVNAYGEQNVRELGERMYELIPEIHEETGMDMLFVIINNKSDDPQENMMYMAARGKEAEELLQKIYGNYDGKRFFIFKENLSRKADIVPALSAALQKAE